MKKKMLFVIDSLNSGGAEKSLVTLLNLLDYNKYEVELMTFRQEGLYIPLIPKEVKMLNSPNIFHKMSVSLFNLLKLKEYRLFIWRLLTALNIRYTKNFTNINHGAQQMWPNLDKIINKYEKIYDVAIAYNQGTPTYYVADKIKATKKICWINIDYKFAGYNKNFDIKYYDKFDNMVGVSEKCTEVLKDVFPEFKDKITTIYDIICEETIVKMANNGDGFEDSFNGIRILTIGRLVYQKGYEYAIQAAKLLKENGVNFRWYAIGEGKLKKDLEELVKVYELEKHFIFLGTYENPYPFIQQCDIYCQPSRFEGYGLAIAEARILNKPIVATNFDIVFDQIKHGKNGLITDMSGESLANAIEELLTNNDLKRNIVMALEEVCHDTEQEILKFYKLLEK